MPRFDIEQSCAFLIHDTARLFRRRFDLAIRDLGLTQARWRVLVWLRQTPALTQSELAERLDIEKAPLGLALDWLEQAGWIRREQDRADRRARRVSLLERAEPTLALMDERFHAVGASYLRGFDADEANELLDSLRAIRDELKGRGGASPAAAQAGNDAARPETYVGALFECARLLARRFDARLAEFGFTRSQWLVINTVHRSEGLHQAEVAEATELGAAALGKLVDALQKGGWLERRADPRDRRANRLFLTRRAQHLLSGMHERFEQMHAELERPLGARRKQQLVSKLGWIRQRLLEESPQHIEPRRAGVQ